MSGCCRSSGPVTLPREVKESTIINALAKSGTPKHPREGQGSLLSFTSSERYCYPQSQN